MMHCLRFLALLVMVPLVEPRLRVVKDGRLLANPPYFSISVSDGGLSPPNNLAALGNPLKGLMGGARWRNPNDWPAKPETSLEWYNIGVRVKGD